MSFLAVLSVFLPYLGGLWTAWQTPEYSHGILIPLLAVFMGWHRLAEAKPVPAPSWAGLLPIFTGFAFLTVSQLSAFEPPAHYGFVLCLAGLTLSFFGWRVLRLLAPSFAYLFFAIPLPRLIEVTLTAKMQLISTTIGVSVLQTLGISVFQEGNIIDLGTAKLQVVEACSGLRYLFPFLSFGFLIAFLFEGSMWKRAVIFLSTVPLTLVMNALRIALAGILVNQWGSGMAEGFVHDFEGWTIFAVCISILLAESYLLSRLAGNGTWLRLDYFDIPSSPLFTGILPVTRSGIGAFALCVLLAAGTIFMTSYSRQDFVPPRISFSTFPLDPEEWHGQQKVLDPDVLETLRATDYWNADYARAGDHSAVNLFMAWYASQRIGVAAHSPANCIPGSGWRVVQRVIVPVETGRMTLPVTRMIIRKDRSAILVYYWFDQRGRIINEQYGAKWYLLLDSITMHRTDGAIIRLLTPLAEGEDESAGDARLKDFLRTVYPLTKDYIPR